MIIRLPLADEFSSMRPRRRGDCETCATCQVWRDQQRTKNPPELLHDRLACGHTTVEAVRRSRPCLFASCRQHLYGTTERGNDAEPEAMAETCALDVADRGGAALVEIGEMLGVTREAVRLIEQSGIAKLANRRGVPLHPFASEGKRVRASTYNRRARVKPVQDEPSIPDVEDGPTSFFDADDAAACRAVWQLISKYHLPPARTMGERSRRGWASRRRG